MPRFFYVVSVLLLCSCGFVGVEVGSGQSLGGGEGSGSGFAALYHASRDLGSVEWYEGDRFLATVEPGAMSSVILLDQSPSPIALRNVGAQRAFFGEPSSLNAETALLVLTGSVLEGIGLFGIETYSGLANEGRAGLRVLNLSSTEIDAYLDATLVGEKLATNTTDEFTSSGGGFRNVILHSAGAVWGSAAPLLTGSVEILAGRDYVLVVRDSLAGNGFELQALATAPR